MHFRNQLNILWSAGLAALLLITPNLAAQNLESAEAARTRAQNADAPILAPKAYQSAERSLSHARRLMEKGSSPGQIAAAFRGATEEFEATELEAISERVLAPARSAIKDANAIRAKRYAPVTLERARELLAAAEAAIREDRYAIADAEALAEEAAATARHAGQIATTVREKPKLENLILEWEKYLARLQAAAGITLPADSKPEEVTEVLEQEIERIRGSELQLRQDLTDSQAFTGAMEDEIRELDQQLGGASAERRELVLQLEKQARGEEQVAQIEAIFLPSEATIFRQSNSIVVRLFGLEFASGSAKLAESNEELLAKVNKAVEVFPDSTLLIEGHTDSQGSNPMNQRLSQNRAEAVQNYLIENFRVSPTRIRAEGYGATRPIANNETEEGRAKNRRIDLLITPE